MLAGPQFRGHFKLHDQLPQQVVGADHSHRVVGFVHHEHTVDAAVDHGVQHVRQAVIQVHEHRPRHT